jgi:ATP-dependent exoDNAse (exonuclease V) alpha subunit
MAVEEILTSRDQVIGLQGTAGAGKTTSLAAIRAAAEQQGYRIEGLAPTSRAAQQLEEAGINAHTLQHHLARGSHSGQGTTADRVLVHVDTANAHEQLINSRLAYVAVSRGRYDAQIYTNNADNLGDELSRDVSKQSAITTDESLTKVPKAEQNPGEEISSNNELTHAQAYGVSHSDGHGMER